MNDDNLDLLDLDDADSVDTLPDAAPFVAPRPKKPWLLLSVGLAVIVLATYIIIRTIGGESSSTIEVDLDAPVAVVDGTGMPVDMNVMPAPKPLKEVAQPKKEAPVQVKTEEPVATMPVRVVEERKEVTFNPAAAPKPATQKPVTKKQESVAKPAVKAAAPKPAVKKPVVQKSVADWYVQFGSYGSRASAESAQRKMIASHPSLFNGKQFVVLAAQLKNGTTTYRLRVPFNTSSDANGFCRNAKSDGLDCYVAK